MRTFLPFCLVLLSVAAVSAGSADIIDEYDWDTIINDDTKFKEIVDCVMGAAPCGDNQKIKDGSLKLLQSNCGECTPEQKEKYKKYLEMVKTKHTKVYNDVHTKIHGQST